MCVVPVATSCAILSVYLTGAAGRTTDPFHANAAATHSVLRYLSQILDPAEFHTGHNPAAWQQAMRVLTGATIVRLVLGAVVPLFPDEAYYWEWSRNLAAGYFDHPPVIALLVRMGTPYLATPRSVSVSFPYSPVRAVRWLLSGSRARSAVMEPRGWPRS